MSEKNVVVISHFDGHGVISGYVVSKYYNAIESYSNYPETSPENLPTLLLNRYSATPQKLTIITVDIPVDLKNPANFIRVLEDMTLRHELIFIDHHESSLQFINMFRNVKTIFVGTSAYLMTKQFVKEKIDEELAIVGAICDRDPEVIKRGLWNQRLQQIADGIDIMIRRTNGAYHVLHRLLDHPEFVIEEAITQSGRIPEATLGRQFGVVGLASEQLPEGWSLKALEKMCFKHNLWYGVGYEFTTRFNQWVVRAIIRWDIRAKYPQLPSPKDIASKIFPTRTIIGHPDAISIASMNREEAQEIASKLAREIADSVVRPSRAITHLVNVDTIGEVLTEILLSIRQILDRQTQMYEEYLKLKEEQVKLLRELREARAD